MTDLEMTKLCAEAMGYRCGLQKIVDCSPGFILSTTTLNSMNLPDGWETGTNDGPYDPFHDDAQAMALVKKFGLDVRGPAQDHLWEVWFALQPEHYHTARDDLNRAIVECVAKMQRARETHK